jgi:ABC-type ATPase with predicted acetyltransferase domain
MVNKEDYIKDPENVTDLWKCQACGHVFGMKSKTCCPKCNSSFVEKLTKADSKKQKL